MLLTIIAFIFVLGVIVLVHELGHFVVSRRAGVKIDEFGLGLPPRIIGIYKTESGRWKIAGPTTKETVNTIWSLNWIPLGGFVKIKGEQGEAGADPDSFGNKSIAIRSLILSAGVSMNIILAIVLYSIGFTIGVPQFIEDRQALPASAQVRDGQIRVIEVLSDSPAGQAGLAVADTVIEIDGQPFSEITTLQAYIEQRVSETLNLAIERDGQRLSYEIVPEILPATNRSGIGVALVETALVSYPWYIAPWFGLIETGRVIVGVIVGFFLIIRSLVVDGQLIGEVYGPVGIAGLIGDAARLGFLYIIQFTAVLSIIIAVINYLPFPALDGGRVLFLVIEAVRGRPVNPKFEALLHNLGFVLLIGLVVIITFRDIARLSSGFANFWTQIGGLF